MNEQIIFKQLQPDEGLERIGKLRIEAWKTKSSVFDKFQGTMVDRFDLNACQWSAWQGDQLVGVARLNIVKEIDDLPDKDVFETVFKSAKNFPIGVLSRLALNPQFGKKGLPSKLRNIRIEQAREYQCRSVYCWALENNTHYNSLLADGFVKIGQAKNHPISEFQTIFDTHPVAVMGRVL